MGWQPPPPPWTLVLTIYASECTEHIKSVSWYAKNRIQYIHLYSKGLSKVSDRRGSKSAKNTWHKFSWLPKGKVVAYSCMCHIRVQKPWKVSLFILVFSDEEIVFAKQPKICVLSVALWHFIVREVTLKPSFHLVFPTVVARSFSTTGYNLHQPAFLLFAVFK